MLTLISWLVVAAIVWWVTGKPMAFVKTLGQMIFISLITTAVLWHFTGIEKDVLWSIVSGVVPLFFLIFIYWKVDDDNRSNNTP